MLVGLILVILVGGALIVKVVAGDDREKAKRTAGWLACIVVCAPLLVVSCYAIK